MAVQTLTSTTPEYQTKKTVQVKPDETQRSVSYQAPTPEMQEYIREHIIKPTAQAYGINPDTGDVTPFQALGYNPDDERKRREAEMALNDRKRKENAWYNAFAVVGDSLTAALGGNVWQRQPNRIGAQANADNQRLIAEQKAEDMNNAAMMRNAGVKYADAVNRLIQNYLTKTTTTNKTGGSRTETTAHPKVVSTRQVLDQSKSGNSSGRFKTVQIQVKDANGNITTEDFHIPANDYDAYGRYLSAAYSRLSAEGKENIDRVLSEHNIMPRDIGNGKYTYNGADLLSSGIVFDDPQIRAKFIEIINADASRTPEEKQHVISIINSYPTDIEGAPDAEVKKDAWYKSFWKWLSGKGNKKKGWGNVPTQSEESQEEEKDF